MAIRARRKGEKPVKGNPGPSGGLTMVFLLFLVQPITACTLLQNTRHEPDPGVRSADNARAVETVERRADELAPLVELAEVKAPRDLGRAQATLGEMVYFRDENEPGEVMRLDGVMAANLALIREAIAASAEAPAERIARLQEQNHNLRSKVILLESEVADLKRELEAQKEVSGIQIDILTGRLEVALKGRDDAVREVVRTRSRIEGMASEAEASAMFAEARVLVDRMVEEAFNDRALGELKQARVYLESGREELDEGNSGGAAYLFDLVSSLYEGFRASGPRKITVGVSDCYLLKSSSDTSQRISRLSQGEVVTGLEAAGDWIRIRTARGQEGWIRKHQVH